MSEAPGRSVFMALVLSGLAPGAGHVYAGHPWRGALFLLVVLVTTMVWIVKIPESWSATLHWFFPPALLTLALIGDSGRVAARAPKPFPLRRWNRWYVYVGLFLVTGLIGPTVVGAWAESRIGLVKQADALMAPSGAEEHDVVLYDAVAYRREAPEAGDVVVVETEARGPLLRRVVAVEGDLVAIKSGLVHRNGRHWPHDLMHPKPLTDLELEERELPPGHVLLLPDVRTAPTVSVPEPVPHGRLLGRAAYVLLPTKLDGLRIGETVR